MRLALYTKLTIILVFLEFLTGCGNDNANPPPSNAAPVYRNANYNVIENRDVIYAQGLSHTDWNSQDTSVINLMVDVYTPDNTAKNRPLMLFIHGGGFQEGDRSDFIPVFLCRYFASRGFVAVSLGYRLEAARGTLPAFMNTSIDNFPGLNEADRNQLKAMYPATRDAKAALRWLVSQAGDLGFDRNNIALIGGSAGAYIAIAVGASQPEDFTTELSANEDSTLASTNLTVDYEVQAVVNHWGGPGTLNLLETVYGVQRWDQNDAPLSIVHGTADATVPFSNAEALVSLYQTSGAYYEFYPLEGAGHGAWNVDVDGQGLDALSFDFIARMLSLQVVED